MAPVHKLLLVSVVLLVAGIALFLTDIASIVTPGIPVPPARWVLRAVTGLMLLGSVLTFVWSIEEHFSPLDH
jgi:EamA domain-containing membrane protein RarD